MRRKLLVLLILFSLTLIFFNMRVLLERITGFVSEIVTLSLTVSNATQGRFIHFSYPEKIYLIFNGSDFVPMETPVFSVIFRNTGNLDITGRIEIHILNSTLHNVSSFYDEVFDLAPLQTKNFSVTWETNLTGTYWVVANASYSSILESKSTEINASFEVVYALNVNLLAMTNVYSFCPGEDVEIVNKLSNTGYLNATGNLTSKIFDTEGNEIFNYTWTNLTIPVNETVYYRERYTVREEDEAGIYTLVSNFSYDGRYSASSAEFRIKKGIGSLVVSPSEIEKTIPRGLSAELSLSLWLQWACNSTTAYLSKSEGAPGDWVTFSKDELFLTPTTGNTTKVTITVPDEAEEGDYYGSLYATADGQTVEIPLIIHVSNITIIEATISFPPDGGYVCLGDTITALVTIRTNTSETVEVSVTYILFDPAMETIYEHSEVLEVTEKLEKNVSFTIPSDGLEGYYTFTVIAKYGEYTDRAHALILARSCVVEITLPPAVEKPVALPPEKPVYKLTLNLSENLIAVLAGGRATFFARVKNEGTMDVTDVRIVVRGIPVDWFNITPSIANITPHEMVNYTIVLNIPENAPPGIYLVKVKASDKVESNEESLKLIIGKNWEELAKLAMEEVERLRMEAKSSLVVEECLDITRIKRMFEEAELSYEKGIGEYVRRNYRVATDWFTHAILVYEKVIERVEIAVEMELEYFKSYSFFVSPLHGGEHYIKLVESYVAQKNYWNVCKPLRMLKKMLMVGVLFWISLVLLILILISLLIALYRERRVLIERFKRIERRLRRLKK